MAAAQRDRTETLPEGRVAEQQAAQSAPPEPLNPEEDIARIAALRAKQPFGAFDRKLDLPPIEGYKQHWFNDRPGRVEMALRAGWSHVLGADGKPRMLIVDRGGMKAYAMKIPQQFWDEDQARQNAKARAALGATKKLPAGVPGKDQASDSKTFYTPHESGSAIEVTRS